MWEGRTKQRQSPPVSVAGPQMVTFYMLSQSVDVTLERTLLVDA